ncbi:MAG: inositol monophosphatase family protein [Patescibacteria group bacterium]
MFSGNKLKQTKTGLDVLKMIATDVAGPAMRKYHGEPGTVASSLKSDVTPVTQADVDIDNHSVEMIQARFGKEVGIIREEGKNFNEGAEMRFTIDGVDGTAEFSRGGTDAVFAGAVETKRLGVESSVIYAPLKPVPLLFWAAQAEGAYLNGRKLEVSQVRDTSKYPVVEIASAPGGPDRIPVQKMFLIAQELQERGFLVNVIKSISYSNAMVAAGVIVGTIFPWQTLWDIAPGDRLVSEAGGQTSDLRGNPIHYRMGPVKGTIMSNGHFHDLLVDVVSKHYSPAWV